MPQRRANSVDFPAPLGPMRQRSSPRFTDTLTLSAAVTPPKRFTSLSVARTVSDIVNASSSPAPPNGRSCDCDDDSPREEQHHKDQEKADDYERRLVPSGREGIGQPIQRVCADRAGQQAIAPSESHPNDWKG